jgi:hypothetical protein
VEETNLFGRPAQYQLEEFSYAIFSCVRSLCCIRRYARECRCRHKGAEPAASSESWQEEVQTRRAQIDKVKAENSPGFEAMDAQIASAF